MRGSFAEYEQEHLIKQVNFTLQQTKVLADCDAFLRKVKKKPIDWEWQLHVFAVMAIAVLIWLLSKVVTLPELNDLAGFFMPFIYVAVYSTFVFVFNRVGIAIKQVQYDKELRQVPVRRREALAALEKHSDVPRDYWKFSYLLLIKSYIDNQRADTMKECLNLLEDEIRRLNLDSKIQELEAHFRSDVYHHHHHVHDPYDEDDGVIS